MSVAPNTKPRKSVPRKQGQLKERANQAAALAHAVQIIHDVCALTGPANMLADVQDDCEHRKHTNAIQRHDTAALFDRLMNGLSYQGIADRVAYEYILRHGQATWAEIDNRLARRPSCPKLRSYWAFAGCRYEKGRHTCAQPQHIEHCPLPRHDLRNGHLNQAAYSLFLFIRDIAAGDLVAWIDEQIATAFDKSSEDGVAASREALLGALRNVYGVSGKVLGMILSIMLLAAPVAWTRWREVGSNMIAIDTLVHNFLHRTGILDRFDAQHAYGNACYQEGGCADILRTVAQAIDAREFNPGFPQTFPRFVQLAVWQYCAQLQFNICNGNRIDDHRRCDNTACQVFERCDRVALQN
jgi:hypothetical protein